MINGLSALTQQITQRLESPDGPAQNAGTSTASKVAPHNFGNALKVELKLDSGESVRLEAQQNRLGKIQNLAIKGYKQLNETEQETVRSVLTQLGESVSKLFNGKGNANLFDFAHSDGIQGLELMVRSQQGEQKQSLNLDWQQGTLGSRKVSSLWQQTDMRTGMKDAHRFSLGSAKLDQSYGQGDYQWLLNHVQQATGALADQRNQNGTVQSQALGQYFNAGVNALFGQMQNVQRSLQGLGASVEQANRFVKLNVQGMLDSASVYQPVEPGNNSPISALFESERILGGSQIDTYQFKLQIQQLSHQWQRSDGLTQSSISRNLNMSYHQAGELIEQIELKWQRSERLNSLWDQQQKLSDHEQIQDWLRYSKTDVAGQQTLQLQDTYRRYQSSDATNNGNRLSDKPQIDHQQKRSILNTN